MDETSLNIYDKILQSLSVISSKYSPSSAQIYNTTYLVKLSGMSSDSPEKIDTIRAIASSSISDVMGALSIDITTVPPIYIRNLKRLFRQLLSST